MLRFSGAFILCHHSTSYDPQKSSSVSPAGREAGTEKKNPSSAHLCQKGNNQLRLPVVCVSAQLLLIKATLSSSDPSPYSKFRHRRSLIVDLMISHCYNDDHRCDHDDDDRTGRARQCKKKYEPAHFCDFLVWFCLWLRLLSVFVSFCLFAIPCEMCMRNIGVAHYVYACLDSMIGAPSL